jgi:outer membrane protein TolC
MNPRLSAPLEKDVNGGYQPHPFDIPRRRRLLRAIPLLLCIPVVCASGQISLRSTVALAEQNSPRVKMVQDDVKRATAALAESKDVYIPTLALGGGLGRSYGISFVVPTIFTATSQSLVYNAAQRDYIRAARDNLRASQAALQDVREQVQEDCALTYLALDEAYARRSVLVDELALATRLYDITQQRAGVGLDSALDVKISRRTLLQIEVQQPEVENDIAGLQEHLSQLTGLALPIVTLHESIPVVEPTPAAPSTAATSPGVLASQASAAARAETARGDLRYAFHPQVLMQAQYGRISPINDVSEYYNLNGRYNSTVVGVAVQLPLFDRAHAARARESAADALHARHEAQQVEGQQREERARLENSLSELSIRAELTKLDWDIAKERLTATALEVKSRSTDANGGRQLTPKDELNVRLEEAQRHLDWLGATLQLQRTQVTISRLNGTLEQWLNPSAAATPPPLTTPSAP